MYSQGLIHVNMRFVRNAKPDLALEPPAPFTCAKFMWDQVGTPCQA